ncbi:patatin-like phospholipase family protein [Altibacter sp.]|uniref:patatin-like phospholipase family protein n=1 Tax=Altibacter sp. TaxID=2024823 RepID=UPI0025868CE2|nr:patatin-like phospholipase family protein [Altibacter sp.]MCW8980972.1 patatin-like phospholipase family protein [Altibacter sp.]MCW9038454.1 patatin-like phospholipase family protein [Altibacter sp.]
MKQLLLIVCILFSGWVVAQNEANEDLKVGLVLSGGGAKGLAHIGALKVIEEAGVRIDYIGGTSMGAIIGSLYASGYSATQLDSIFNNTDFDKLIQDEIPRSAKTFYEKDEAEKYALTLPFDKFQVSFPSALSKGQNVYNLLSRLTAHVSTIEDFNKLPIPFFCVATNVETGKEVILNKGYLPRAITASGALPSLFSPVEIDGVLMVDGGVVNNYPVDEVRAMGADIVIGVDVQDSLRSRDKLKSAFDVLVQINNYRTINDMAKKRKRTDIYIHPNIDEFTVVAFNQGDSIVSAGEREAQSFREELLEIAARQKGNLREPVDFVTRDSLYIKNVEIEGLKNYTRSYVLGKLKLFTPGKTSYKRFNEGINNLSATGNFQDINYRLEEDENGKTSVLLNLRESASNTLLRLGAHYDDLFRTAALINVTRKRLFTNNDIVSFDFIVGDNIRYNFDYYIDKGYYWSIGLNSRFSFFDKDVPIDFITNESISPTDTQLNQISLKYGDVTNQVYVETLFRRTFLLGMGVEHKWLRYLSETIGIDDQNNPRTIFENTNYFSAYGYLKYDTFDNSYFPNDGLFFKGDFHLYVFAEGINNNFDQFSISKAKMAYATSFTPKLSMIVSTEGGFKIGGSTTNSLDFFVGGYGFRNLNNLISLYGYEALSLRGDTYLKSTLTLDYELFKKNHLNISGNIANVGDRLFTTGQWIDGVDYSGFALGYGLETFLGPMEVKYAYSPELDESNWYVSVGFRF